jgi:RIO kinase 1
VGLNRVNEDLADLDTFVGSAVLEEVLGVVKSGKEATVYCARGGERFGHKLVAAKVYRSMKVRQFANASTYNAGRLRSRGMRDGIRSREIRAMQNRSRLGQELSFGKWVADEWETLQLLHRNNVSVPEPYMMSERVILMEYIGDDDDPAPNLTNLDFDAVEAERLFRDIIGDIELMLASDRIHGDLSPYNVLYHEGRVRIIDVPQAVDARFNPNALDLLDRDVDNICRHFARFDVRADAWRISRDLWARYLRSDL